MILYFVPPRFIFKIQTPGINMRRQALDLFCNGNVSHAKGEEKKSFSPWQVQCLVKKKMIWVKLLSYRICLRQCKVFIKNTICEIVRQHLCGSALSFINWILKCFLICFLGKLPSNKFGFTKINSIFAITSIFIYVSFPGIIGSVCYRCVIVALNVAKLFKLLQ